MRLTALLLALLLTIGCAVSTTQPSSRSSDASQQAIRQAAEFLWTQQSADGGWHSQTYGLLRSGQSLTPFVLNALLQAPPKIYPRLETKVDAALAFIARHTDADGAVGRNDPTLEDYPNYATALAVQAICRARRDGWRERIAPMLTCLRRQQFTEERGWTREHSAFGAWGMGGPLRAPPHTGHVDLSMTRHALEAFALAGITADDPTLQNAQIFLGRCQNADSGFIFSPVIVDTNKAGRDGKRDRSYATPTADGILALLATGISAKDPRVTTARDWLVKNHRPDRAAGFLPNDPREVWAKALRYYCAAASAQALEQLGGTPDTLREQTALLTREQRPDGSWRNPMPLMKEDDPLLATTLALSALIASPQ